MADHDYLLKRAALVFGTQSFQVPQLAIETKRRNAEIIESLDALVADGRIVVASESPRTYKIKT